MITRENIDNILTNNGKVIDSTGAKIGSVGQVYLDDQSGAASWVTVKTGLFGTSESFAPLEGARMDGDDVLVQCTKDQLKGAPRMDPDGDLSPEEENELYEYYNLASPSTDRGGRDDRTGHGREKNTSGRAGEDRDPGRASGEGDSMTRSEEHLKVGTETHETGRVRLRKHVVTENVTKTVPVTHEEVVLEREPITDNDAGAAGHGAQLGEDEQDVVLHEDQVVVEKETVPVEKVRLDTMTVAEEQTVNEQVRKEEIDTEGDTKGGTKGGTKR